MSQTQQTPCEDYMAVHSIIKIVGEFGKFQIAFMILFLLFCIPECCQMYSIIFIATVPSWKYVNDTLPWQPNQTFPASDLTRCKVPYRNWTYLKPDSHSIVTDFKIDCEQHWVVMVTSSAIFAGIMFGAYPLGWLADNYGRRKVLIPSLSGIILIGSISAFSPNIWILVICRFIVGFLLPGNTASVFSLMSEMVGPKYRARVISLIYMNSGISLLLLNLITCFLKSWRYIVLLSTAPFIVVLVFLKYVPESMYWNQSKGKGKELWETLKMIAKYNQSEILNKVRLMVPAKTNNHVKTSVKDLFKTRTMTATTTIIIFASAVLAASYFAISLAADSFSSDLHINVLIISLAELPAVIATFLATDRFGRRNAIITANTMTGIFCITVASLQSDTHAFTICRLIAGALGKIGATIAYFGFYTWTAEIYPTLLRTQGLSCLFAGSKIGGTLTPWIVKGLSAYHASIPFAILGSIALLTTPFLLMLPETKGRQFNEEFTFDENSMEPSADVKLLDEASSSKSL